MTEEFKPRPRLTPENLVSAIAYCTLSENNIDEEELHAVAYYLEELCSVKRQLSVTEAQNKRVLEKLNLITRYNQELQTELAEKEKLLNQSRERFTNFVNMEWQRPFANKYIEMRRKEDPKLLFPDSDEVYQRYFEQKEYIEKLETDLDQAYELDDIYADKLRKRQEDYEKLKISFAVEQLEKIDKFVKSGYCFDLGDVRNEIDNQIKAIKEME